ncbi:hypothetical protein Tco_0250989 [Tanacetum coccineum]
MTTPITSSTTDSQMHNNIMEAGSRDRPPMLATGRYPQWQSRFLRYIDIRPNGDAFRKCILEGLYQPTTVTIPAVPAIENSPAVPERTVVETLLSMSPENKAHYKSEKEAIYLLLTGIGDEIYSTVDACKTAHEMWIAIERLQQGESLNIQDVKTNLFWEFGKFTSHDGESMKSYYSRFYKMMNEMIRNNLTVATISNASTKFKGKEIAKPITPLSESASKEDSDPEQAQRDKDMQKNLALIEKYFKKIYKPTNNNLITSLNSKNKNVDTTPRYKNDNQIGQFGNQRTMTVARAWETIGSQVQNDAEYNVFANVRQHSEQPESTSNTCLVEKDDSNVTLDSPDMCDNDIQTDQNAEDERVTLANLIANLKVNVDDNKKIQKKLKKANASLVHELKECKSILAETSRTLEESNSIWDSCLIALQNKQTEFERFLGQDISGMNLIKRIRCDFAMVDNGIPSKEILKRDIVKQCDTAEGRRITFPCCIKNTTQTFLFAFTVYLNKTPELMEESISEKTPSPFQFFKTLLQAHPVHHKILTLLASAG